jgi:hypothetical protein
MTDLAPIPLDSDWRYFPTEDLDPADTVAQLDESAWGVLPTLADYPREVVSFYRLLHVQRCFDLQPIDDLCVRYHLHLDHAPDGTQVYINGWHAGTVQSGKSLISDVTDFVTLEANLLLLKINREGDLRGVSLRPVPCE